MRSGIINFPTKSQKLYYMIILSHKKCPNVYVELSTVFTSAAIIDLINLLNLYSKKGAQYCLNKFISWVGDLTNAWHIYQIYVYSRTYLVLLASIHPGVQLGFISVVQCGPTDRVYELKKKILLTAEIAIQIMQL